MVRSKVKLECIEDDSSKKSSYKKRSKGLLKKTNELSKLCGVQACTIVYGENLQEPVVWPAQNEANEAMTRLREMPQYQQNNHKQTLQTSTTENINKFEQKLEKARLKTKHKDLEHYVYMELRGERPSNLGVDELDGIAWTAKQKMDGIDELVEKKKCDSEKPKEEGTMSPSGNHEHSPQPGPEIPCKVMGGDLLEDDDNANEDSEEIEMISGMWGETFPHGVELLSKKGDHVR